MNKKFTIWIIDDDDISKYVMKRNLKELNIQNVVDFPDSVGALTLLNAQADNPQALPDLIFLDMHMPFMDGFQFLEAFKDIQHTLKRHISIYMLSSSLNSEDMLRAKSFSSVLDFLVKPLELDLLQQLIETVTQD